MTPEELVSLEQALAWFAAERPVLLGLMDLAGEVGLDVHRQRLAWTVANYLERNGLSRDCVATQSAALDAARRMSDKAGQASAERGPMDICHQIGAADADALRARIDSLARPAGPRDPAVDTASE